MFGIVTCGVPQGSRVGDHPHLRALGTPDAGQLRGDHIIDVVGPALEQGATVVALVPTWDLEPTLTHLHMARSALESTRLVIHRTSLPPLAAGVFSFTLAEFARRELLPAGVLVSCLRALERHVVGAAWLGSVARLRDPAPRLGQHARSYLPGTAFGAVVDDDPRVRMLRRKDAPTLDLPAPRIPGGWRVTVAEGQEVDAETVRRSVTQHAAGASTEHVDLSPISIDWWGTSKLAELALAPADLDALASALVVGVTAERCAWCAELIATDPCPFCGARADAPAPTLDEVPSGGRT